MGIFGSIAGGLGSIVETVSDAIGLPEEIGDFAALTANALTGNWAGVAFDAADLLFDVDVDALVSDELVGGLTQDVDGEAWTALASVLSDFRV